jgi:hypothetical protein
MPRMAVRAAERMRAGWNSRAGEAIRCIDTHKRRGRHLCSPCCRDAWPARQSTVRSSC